MENNTVLSITETLYNYTEVIITKTFVKVFIPNTKIGSFLVEEKGQPMKVELLTFSFY